MYINDLIDKALTMANLKTDYRLSKVLDVPNGWIAEYRTGKRHPSTAECVKLAALTDQEEMEVIAHVEYETTKSDKKKKFWKNYMESRGVTATACMIALGVSIMLTPEPAQASVLQLPNYDADFSRPAIKGNIHYASLRCRNQIVMSGFSQLEMSVFW